MSMISDFINDLSGLNEIDEDGDRAAVPVNAVVANLSPTGEGIAVSVNDGYSSLAYSGQGYEVQTNIQVDVYTKSYVRLMEIKDAVIKRYHGKALKLGQTKFHKMVITFSQESAANLNESVYRAIISLQTITKE